MRACATNFLNPLAPTSCCGGWGGAGWYIVDSWGHASGCGSTVKVPGGPYEVENSQYCQYRGSYAEWLAMDTWCELTGGGEINGWSWTQSLSGPYPTSAC